MALTRCETTHDASLGEFGGLGRGWMILGAAAIRLEVRRAQERLG
jgi:hypothetical protein